MLATQLCAFNDKTDSKSKLVKKLTGIWLRCLDYYLVCFVTISWRPIQIECVTPQLKQLEKLKLSASTESATAVNV